MSLLLHKQIRALCAISLLAIAPRGPHALPGRVKSPPTARLSSAPARAAIGMGRLLAADLDVGFRLYARLARQGPRDNVFLSPFSVASALDLASDGAHGGTRQAMAATLGLRGMDPDAVDRANAALRAHLAGLDARVQFADANALWVRPGFPLVPAFVRRAAGAYGATVAPLAFGRPQAAATINAWAARQTRGQIGHVVTTTDPATQLYLLNALYFKGTWTVAFDRARTRDGPFTTGDGHTVTLPLMAQTGDYLYEQGPDFQAVSLPYGSGRASMDIFLPNTRSGLGAFERRLTSRAWATWMSRFHVEKGAVVLPRFRVAYRASLVPALGAMGMAPAFDGGADFAGLTPRAVALNAVDHQAIMEVNEEGTTAAATTGASFETITTGFSLVVDRPFFCAIRDNTTGAVLFMGSILRPAAL